MALFPYLRLASWAGPSLFFGSNVKLQAGLGFRQPLPVGSLHSALTASVGNTVRFMFLRKGPTS